MKCKIVSSLKFIWYKIKRSTKI